MMTKFSNIIFSSNRVWNLMYFDEFQEHQLYQITYLESADRPYYNCAHVDKNLPLKEVVDIERFFDSKNLPARFYTHTYTNIDFIRVLEKRGYIEIPKEEEIWYEYDLMQGGKDFDQFFKGNINDICFKEIDPQSSELESFMKLNQTQNEIPEEISKKFVKNIRSRLSGNIENIYYSAYIDGIVATIGTRADIDQTSFFSEGATDPRFSRKGLYSTLLAYRISLCRTSGLRFAYVRCDKEAFSNHGCKKVGFKKIFTRTLWERK